ncbi:hypothetical protein [Solobacterium moorei]|nr:hypothetical protein [Solobacterium moorei]
MKTNNSEPSLEEGISALIAVANNRAQIILPVPLAIRLSSQ